MSKPLNYLTQVKYYGNPYGDIYRKKHNEMSMRNNHINR